MSDARWVVTFTTVDIQKSYIGCHRENIWLERGIYTQIIRYMILNFIQNDSLLHAEEYFFAETSILFNTNVE